jgi:hypothetical protein
MQAMSLGAADFAASMGMQTTGIGGTQENYYMLHEGARHYSDPWHWAQAAIVSACRTHGVLPVDGPFGDFSDDEGYRAQARRSATLGMVGKWAIHPKQVALANEVFTPSEAAVTEAREILAAMEEAKASGAGATVYKGRLVDIASIKQAEVIVKQAEMIAKCPDGEGALFRRRGRPDRGPSCIRRRAHRHIPSARTGTGAAEPHELPRLRKTPRRNRRQGRGAARAGAPTRRWMSNRRPRRSTRRPPICCATSTNP